jgi:primosomal protein N' (replication factor Y)
MEQMLIEQFPDHEVLRIDRDTTRNKGALQSALESARAGSARILVGTQMLAKGHHFPGVTLVVILDVDQGLFGADFRAAERMAQLIIQVAGRAGRGDRPGEVIIQTHQPEHPLLRQLVEQGYAAFAAEALAERRQAALPPFASLALLRADATDADKPTAFLEEAKARAQELCGDEIELWGPVPAPMERRAGRFRAQLMLQSTDRTALQRLLHHWVPALAELESARKVRWSVDVDPQDVL